MRITLTHNDFDGAFIVSDSNGANVTNLPVGDYSVYVTLPLSSNAGWLNLNIGVSSGVTKSRPSCERTINWVEWIHPIEFGHDAESNPDEYEDTGFHEQQRRRHQAWRRRDHVREQARLVIIPGQFLKRCNTVAQIIRQRRFRIILQKIRLDDLAELR